MVYWTEEDFKEIYGCYQESGLSIREFCNREGILEGRFHHWNKDSAVMIPPEWYHLGNIIILNHLIDINPRIPFGERGFFISLRYS